MTEVVTSSAAFSQLNLLAQRQQVFVVERQSGLDSASATDPYAAQSFDSISNANRVAPTDGATAGHHGSSEPEKEQEPAQNRGPSRPRVEIRSFDVGLTPSEVVGTLDVLQRFDANGDGRVDLLESEKATLVRQKSTTFAGLAAGPAQGSFVASPLDEAAIADAPPAAPEVAADANTPKKLFNTAGQAIAATEGGVPKKLFADVAAAAQGAPTAGADVPKKFYGQGAEVVVGPAAAATAEPAVKLSEKVVIKDQAPVTEDGTGEAKLYDKVAQADTGQPQGEAPGEDGKLFERAQQLAAELHGNKKTVVVEVTAYANTAAITTGEPAAAGATTVVTA